MSVICDLALAIGISFAGACVTGEQSAYPLPKDDLTAWNFEAPPPEPEPEPEPVPAFPPVVIERVIEKTVVREITKEVPVTEPKPGPDYFKLAVEAAYVQRQTAITEWPSVEVPAFIVSETFDEQFSPPAPSATSLQTTPPPSTYEAASVTSGLPVDNSRVVVADRYITGILETGINSQLDGDAGGEIIIQVSRPTYGYHGRTILIPKGSRIICDYTSPQTIGSTRLAITCKRILLAGNRVEIFELAANAGDVQGRAGITGDVDNRFWEKYGTAFLLTAVSTAVRTASGVGESELAKIGSEELSEKFGEITASVLEQSVNLAPIITVPQGTRIQIRPKNDWYIQSVSQTRG